MKLKWAYETIEMAIELMHISVYNSGFCQRLDPSHQTILGWVFVKCSYFLKPCCIYAPEVSLLSIARKEKDEW